MGMDTTDILLRIEHTLGKHAAMLEGIKDDTKEIKREAKYTNGKVRSLRSDVDNVVGDIEVLYQYHRKKPQSAATQENPVTKVTWEKMLFIFGSIATVLAYAIEKLSG